MIGWLVQTLVAVTLLMVVVLMLRRPVANYFGAGWAYALWILPALRLVLPPMPFFEIEMPSVLPSAYAFIPAAAEGAAAPMSLPSGSPEQQMPLYLAIWSGGAAVFLIWQWASYRMFLRRIEASATAAEPPVFGGIGTIASHAVQGPLALGLLKRRIVLPADFIERYTPTEQRLALEHELTHHLRGDMWWNMAALLMLAFNWFNPVAWFAFRAFRADQELSCDAAVTADASANEKHDYGCALVKAASHPGLITVCPLNHADQLKRRLKMIKNHRSSLLRSIGGTAVLAALLPAGLVLSSPSFAQEAKEKVGDVVILAGPDDELKDGKMHTRVFTGDPATMPALSARPFTRAIRPGQDIQRAERPMTCDVSQTFEADIGEAGENDRLKFFICNEGTTNADMVATLEKALARIDQESPMPAAHRERTVAAIKAEIARRKAAS
ncbi:MAG TPA: M56 family metallopeptidase [Allosphingosinicella sp.]|uniref:M56 family metallopeptidase n=1 Tax=Allosphingosinicella sp. TaxID=2823234 RepID=UPI002EDB69B9